MKVCTLILQLNCQTLMVIYEIQAESFSFQGVLRRRAAVVITDCLEKDASGGSCKLHTSVCVVAT